MVDKIKINSDAFAYPMPVALIGTLINDIPNFMTASWISKVNIKPPMMAVSIANRRHTMQGIQKHEQFSINIPDTSLLAKTDYCGLVSGKNKDKSTIFEVFSGSLKKAPMIEGCPLTTECKLVQLVELKDHTLCIGKIMNVYTEERFLSNDGVPDVTKIKPFIFTMPDNNYWTMRGTLGKAWNMGKQFGMDKKT